MAKTEREFLIKFAIDKYNEQFGTSLLYSDFNIRSLEPNFNTDLGYELQTNNQIDFLRLRVYLLFSNTSMLYDYKLENDFQTGHGNLLDEVFVTLGTMSDYYRKEGIYKFHFLNETDAIALAILLSEDGDYLATEDGELILFTE